MYSSARTTLSILLNMLSLGGPGHIPWKIMKVYAPKIESGIGVR